LSPLLAHKEDNVLDVAIPDEQVYLLSNNGYERLATRKKLHFLGAQVPQISLLAAKYMDPLKRALYADLVEN